jgi:hypothetical protein
MTTPFFPALRRFCGKIRFHRYFPFELSQEGNEGADVCSRHDVVFSVIEALKGQPLFGHITLMRSERSAIAALVTDLLEEGYPAA